VVKCGKNVDKMLMDFTIKKRDAFAGFYFKSSAVKSSENPVKKMLTGMNNQALKSPGKFLVLF